MQVLLRLTYHFMTFHFIENCQAKLNSTVVRGLPLSVLIMSKGDNPMPAVRKVPIGKSDYFLDFILTAFKFLKTQNK